MGDHGVSWVSTEYIGAHGVPWESMEDLHRVDKNGVPMVDVNGVPMPSRAFSMPAQ